jgi:hypothetical protein
VLKDENEWEMGEFDVVARADGLNCEYLAVDLSLGVIIFDVLLEDFIMLMMEGHA